MNKLIEAIKNFYYMLFPPEPINVFRKLGCEIGKNVHISLTGVIIDPTHAWLIKLGDGVAIAPNVHILAHDASTKKDLKYSRLGAVVIEENVFIGAGSVILPGVTIGKNSIIGAGSIVSKSIPSDVLAVGNPCRVICSKAEYLEKQKKLMTTENCLDESFTLRGNITSEKKKLMNDLINKHGCIFIE